MGREIIDSAMLERRLTMTEVNIFSFNSETRPFMRLETQPLA